MKNNGLFLVLLSGIMAGSGVVNAATSDELSPTILENNMKKVAEWEINRGRGYSPSNWVFGVFYSGLSQYGMMDPEGPAWPAIRKAGDKCKWNLAFQTPDGYFADDHCIGHAWLELAAMEDSDDPLRVLKPVLEKVLKFPSKAPLEFKKPRAKDRWSWCDSLFMGPPTFVKMAGYTGDEKYLNFVDKEYKATYDYLFDKTHNLFSRDSNYFDKKSANGEKMFWSRGNAWVIAGLPLVLRDMPEDWPNRPFYVDLLKTMAKKLKDIQCEDGSWHPALLDPKDPDTKEMSGTLLNTYALAWGVNNGILPEAEYLPVIKKAWKAISDCVAEDGTMGYVQPVGESPKNCNEKSTEAYGAGGYLLVAGELRKMAILKEHPKAREVEVVNTLSLFRPRETVSVSWPDLKMSPDKVRVFDTRNGRVITHQIVDVNGDGQPDELLFQGDFLARSTRDYYIFESTTLPAAKSDMICFSRPVPERMDDFAWENDRTAHRAYGPTVAQPAPKGEGLVSSGYDVWSKCVSYPVLDKFYKNGNYHTNHGEGMDWYKVGNGSGCGSLGYFSEGNTYTARNWKSAKTLTTGPIRTIFELTYDTFDAGKGITVSEKRIGSLDAGSSMTRFSAFLDIKGAKSVNVGPGVDIARKHAHNGLVTANMENGTITLWGPSDKKNGTMGIAVYLPQKDAQAQTSALNCIYMVGKATSEKPLVWYAGSAWDKAGRYTTADSWNKYVDNFAKREQNPLQVKVLPVQ